MKVYWTQKAPSRLDGVHACITQRFKYSDPTMRQPLHG